MSARASSVILAALAVACGSRSVLDVPAGSASENGALIAASSVNTCALFDDRVCCWGGDRWTSPVRVALPGVPSSLAVLGNGACALVGTDLHCWKEDAAPSLTASGIVGVSANEGHACA